MIFMLEKTIESKFKKAVESFGCRCLKFVSPGCAGVPDRIVLIPGGKICFVELKAPGKTERPRQRHVQDQLRRLGFTVYSSVDDGRLAETVQQIRFMAEGRRQKAEGR